MEQTELAKYRNDLEFIRLAARQTETDFNRMGYEIELEEFPSGFAILCEQLTLIVKGFCKGDNRLEAVLYHIDVPVKMLHPLHACKNPAYTAEIILQRELIKVVLKKLYSSGNGE